MRGSRRWAGLAAALAAGAVACDNVAVVETEYALAWLATPPDSLRESDSALAEVELRDGAGQPVTTVDGTTVELRFAYHGSDTMPGTACGLVCAATVAQGRAVFSLAWISAGDWTARACARHPTDGSELCAEHALHVRPVHATLVAYPTDSVGRRVRFSIEARLRLANGAEVTDQVRTVRLRFTSPRPEPPGGRVRCPEAGPTCERASVAGVARLDSVMVVDTGSTVLAACVVAPNGLERCDPAGAREFRATIPPARLRFAVEPSGAVAGVPFAVQPAVEALEPDGTRRTDYTGVISLALQGDGLGSYLAGTGPDGLTARGPVTMQAVGGLATAVNLRVTRPGSAYALAATAPGDTPDTAAAFPVSLDAAQLEFARLAGDSQYALVGTPLPVVPTVRLTGPLADPITGVAVSFVTGEGSGAVEVALDTTDAGGTASAGAWTIGPDTGVNQLAATMPGRILAFSAEGVVVVGFDVISSPVDATPGDTLRPAFVIDLVDHAGRRVFGARDTVVMQLYEYLHGDRLPVPLGGTPARAAVDGRATFDDLSLPADAEGRYEIETFRSLAPEGETNFYYNLPLKLHHLAFLTPPSDVVVGDTMRPAVVVALLNRRGETVASATDVVVVTVNTDVIGTTEREPVNGWATFDDLILTDAYGDGDMVEMWAELRDRPEISVNLAAEFRVYSRGSLEKEDGESQSTTPNTAVPVAPTVRVLDRDGMPAAGVTVTFTAVAGGGTVIGPVQVTGDDGRARPDSWTLGPDLGLNQLQASAEWLDPVTFSAYAIEPFFGTAVVSAGYDFTCATSADTSLPYCWGENGYGQLGDGTQTVRTRPTLLAAGFINMTRISAGLRYACGLRTDGAAYCWGDNSFGQLGTGNRDSVWTPALVSGGRTFEQIAAGAGHTCALEETGAAWCWGAWQANGQTVDTTVPVSVDGLHQFTGIVAGSWHTCGLDGSGDAWCWGDNTYGQLGDSTVAYHTATPTRVRGGRTFTALAAGSIHTCGISDSRVYCWGSNGEGQIGNGTTSFTPVWSPVEALGVLGTAYRLAAGGGHSCAVTLGLDAAVDTYCWGRNDHGQLGDGTTTHRTSGARVFGNTPFASITVGYDHTCGTQTTGRTYCWGWNYLGRLGIGVFNGTTYVMPMQVVVP